ncbi:MAG TPA: amino acid ABC transporter substrate-binding protein [Hyphomicrobiaceae bacterium]|jgi:branched-chain amino acid transport system substrate-binding protein|nr:amino acid ABC transporter substrate-binding protein [Hyphomicrobiaceae bacterium]
MLPIVRIAPILLTAAFALAATSARAEDIRIGASISLTGTYAKPGTYTQEGYLLCEKEINDKGGLLGRKVKFVVYDDKSEPPTAIKLYEKLITEDKVELVMGPYSSPVTNAASTVSEKYKKLMVASLAATTSIWERGYKYLFMTISPAEVYLEGMIEIAAKNGLKTVAVLNEDTLFSKAAANGTIDLAKKHGMQVVFHEAYPKGTTDFTPILIKIKSLNPDVIAAGSYFDDSVAITRQMKELDVNPKMYGVTVGGDLPEFYKLLDKTAEYVYGSSQWEDHLPYPGAKEFLASYRAMWKHEPSYHAAAAYGSCQVFAEAIRKANSLDSDKLREVLLNLKTTTAFGDYAVDARGFQTAHKMVVHQWQNGKKVTVWPDNLADGKPKFPTPPWNSR